MRIALPDHPYLFAPHPPCTHGTFLTHQTATTAASSRFIAHFVVFREQMAVSIEGHGNRAMPHDRLDSFRRPTKRLNKQTGAAWRRE